MATSFVSPGLYTREDDQSVYVSALSGTRLGVVTTASWGPVNEPVIITSSANLFDTFGPLTGSSGYSAATDSYPDMPGLYAIERYMRRGRMATVVRVATDDAAKAYSFIPGVDTNRSIPSKSTIYPILSTAPIVSLEPIVSESSGTFPEGDYYITYTWANDLGESLPYEGELLEGLGSNGAIDITLPASQPNSNELYTHLNIYITAAGAASVATAKYVGKIKWVAQNPTPVVVTIKNPPVNRKSDAFKVEAAYPGTFGDRVRIRVVTGAVSKPNKPTSKILTLIAPAENNKQNTLTPKQVEAFDGIEANSQIYNTSSVLIDNPNYGPNRVNNGFSKYINLSLIQPPSTNTSDSSNPSTQLGVGNGFGVSSVYSGRLIAGQYRVGYTYVDELGETTVGSSPNTVTVDDGEAITFDLTSGLSGISSVRVYIGRGGSSATMYLVSEVAVVDGKVSVILENSADQQVLDPTPAGSSWHVALSGGDDGLPTTGDSSTFIGVAATESTSPTGLQIFRNKEAVRVSLIAAPGMYYADVVAELIDIAESGRGDCLALIDPPPALTPQGVMTWHNGTSGDSYAPTLPLDSSYAALFWPWCQVNDSYNSVNTPLGVSGQKLYLPPSAFAAEAIAFTDYISEPWYAPAGLNRGRITGITKVQYTPNQGDRDILYSEGNAVNCIATFAQTGVAIWGQRTLQRTPTALDRINVRRLMIYLREQIRSSSLRLVFEPNTASLWRRFTGIIEPFLRSVKNGQGIVDYKIVMDASTNPPEVVEQNMARGIIYIKPTKTAEMIVLDFVVTNQSSNFDETVA